MNIVAWNVNGYSDKIHEKLLTTNYDILFLSETKKSKEYLETKLKDFTNYNVLINAHKPCNIHGVVMLIKKGIDYEPVDIKLDIAPRSDNKSGNPTSGRIIVILVNDVYIVGTYVPNSGGTANQTKLSYRTNTWDPALSKTLNGLGNKVVWLGDINVAPTNDDVSHPQTMCHYAGFTTEECNNINNFLKDGVWVDVWRHFNKDAKMYSWIGFPNKKNYGLRLDNIIVTKDLLLHISNTFIDCTFNLSDHLPVGCTVNFK